MIIKISIDEKNQITRDTLDRLLYCKGFKEELLKLNAKYNPHNSVKYTYDAGEVSKSTINPLFPLEEVLH